MALAKGPIAIGINAHPFSAEQMAKMNFEVLDESLQKEHFRQFLVGVANCYEFQGAMAVRFGGKILNAACADDPAHIGDIGGINLDIQQKESWSGHDFTQTKNFVHGSVLDMPFPDDNFDTVILGEFLEHCKFEKAVEALAECRRVLRSGGHLVMTIPLDGRSNEEQRGPDDKLGAVPEEYDAGISCFHQTWWGNALLDNLRKRARFSEVLRMPLIYFLTAPLGGWGLVWRKP